MRDKEISLLLGELGEPSKIETSEHKESSSESKCSLSESVGKVGARAMRLDCATYSVFVS